MVGLRASQSKSRAAHWPEERARLEGHVPILAAAHAPGCTTSTLAQQSVLDRPSLPPRRALQTQHRASQLTPASQQHVTKTRTEAVQAEEGERGREGREGGSTNGDPHLSLLMAVIAFKYS